MRHPSWITQDDILIYVMQAHRDKTYEKVDRAVGLLAFQYRGCKTAAVSLDLRGGI